MASLEADHGSKESTEKKDTQRRKTSNLLSSSRRAAGSHNIRLQKHSARPEIFQHPTVESFRTSRIKSADPKYQQ